MDTTSVYTTSNLCILVVDILMKLLSWLTSNETSNSSTSTLICCTQLQVKLPSMHVLVDASSDQTCYL